MDIKGVIMYAVAALIAGFCFAFFLNLNCKSTQSRANENYTENCHSYVLHLAKEKRYDEAVLANCLCQQSAKQSDQNLCKGIVRTYIGRLIKDQCNAEKEDPARRECVNFFSKDWN